MIAGRGDNLEGSAAVASEAWQHPASQRDSGTSVYAVYVVSVCTVYLVMRQGTV